MDRGKELGPLLIIKMKMELMNRLNLRNLNENLWTVSDPLNGKNFESVMADPGRVRDRILSGPITRTVPVIPVLSVPFFVIGGGN